MRCYILSILVVLPLLFTLSVNAQHSRTLAKRIMVKTNFLNIIFKKPTLSIEKALTATITAEGSFVQGKYENFLFADHYDFSGFLLRTKKYFNTVQYVKQIPTWLFMSVP
jgi:hypothetical protein